MADNKTIALSWLQGIHRELPNSGVNVSQFISSLRLTHYNEFIPEADFQEWLDSLGYRINLSPTVQKNVKDKIISTFSGKTNQIPTRKTIDSAFLNLANTAFSYFDAAKVVALEVVNIGKLTAQTGGKLLFSVSTGVTSALNIAKFLLIPAAGFVVWSVWKNRDDASKGVIRGIGNISGRITNRFAEFGDKAISKVEDFGGRLYNKGVVKAKLNPRRVNKKRTRR